MRALIGGGVALAMLLAGAAVASLAAPRPPRFTPPSESTLPKGPEGAAIRRGLRLFTQTQQAAGDYAGSGLNCANCHLDAGRRAGAAPMWAAWVAYPAYRAKNDRINTMEDRISDCFLYSMNAPASRRGAPPPPGDNIYRDLQIYFAWLARGLPSGTEIAGRGYPRLTPPPGGPDRARGRAVFAQKCAACHGADGAGQPNPEGGYTVPPLWGERAFNWGAGMARLANAAGFIKANMPYGEGNSLSDRQAWDVAAYVMSQERPRDPRQTGSITEARARWHDAGDYYGQVIDGDLRGDGVVATTR